MLSTSSAVNVRPSSFLVIPVAQYAASGCTFLLGQELANAYTYGSLNREQQFVYGQKIRIAG